ncbi:MAG: response regulator [Actinomycetota bacterium]|nr:response regulator [Actinomycetota bacterium]
MDITEHRTGTAGDAEAAEWPVATDHRAPRNGRLNGNGNGNEKAPRVLIVDDDPDIRRLCAINLQIEGFLVLEAEDGGRGLEQARSERPDLVVTDVTMPGLDGFQLAEELRRDERTSQIPVIFLSGESGKANADRAQELGALAYVTKPFDGSALSSLVADVLDFTDKHVERKALSRVSALSANHRLLELKRDQQDVDPPPRRRDAS